MLAPHYSIPISIIAMYASAKVPVKDLLGVATVHDDESGEPKAYVITVRGKSKKDTWTRGGQLGWQKQILDLVFAM